MARRGRFQQHHRGHNARGANVISGNGIFGANINNPDTLGNVIQGNPIGTDVDGTDELPNAAGGVILTNYTSQNLVGGSEDGAGNLISGNGGDDVMVNAATISSKATSSRKTPSPASPSPGPIRPAT